MQYPREIYSANISGQAIHVLAERYIHMRLNVCRDVDTAVMYLDKAVWKALFGFEELSEECRCGSEIRINRTKELRQRLNDGLTTLLDWKTKNEATPIDTSYEYLLEFVTSGLGSMRVFLDEIYDVRKHLSADRMHAELVTRGNGMFLSMALGCLQGASRHAFEGGFSLESERWLLCRTE